jgi:hypothetical protein
VSSPEKLGPLAARAQSLFAGFHHPKIMIEPAQRELDGFAALLQSDYDQLHHFVAAGGRHPKRQRANEAS